MPARKKGLGRRLVAARYIYLLLLPGLVYYLIFCYIPMGGVVMAFQNYKARLGIFGSPWVGLDNFRRIFITPRATDAILNTLRISFCSILFTFPEPIILALLLNEVKAERFKKTVQTLSYLPNFVSLVVSCFSVSSLR